MLRTGDVYTTIHSNLSSVQVVFHLVADDNLRTTDISSRHPCIQGLRNIVQLATRNAISNISLPLLLIDLETMSAEMTNAWVLTRAELMFKCLKGFLMESFATGSPNPGCALVGESPHYNVNFALPMQLNHSLFQQITEMFSSIFHLVPSLSA